MIMVGIIHQEPFLSISHVLCFILPTKAFHTWLFFASYDIHLLASSATSIRPQSRRNNDDASLVTVDDTTSSDSDTSLARALDAALQQQRTPPRVRRGRRLNAQPSSRRRGRTPPQRRNLSEQEFIQALDQALMTPWTLHLLFLVRNPYPKSRYPIFNML